MDSSRIRARAIVRDESGSMLIELTITLMFIAVAVAALMSVYTSGIISLRHASVQGTARALAASRLEELRALPFSQLQVATLPASVGDPYYTSPPAGVSGSDAAAQTTGGAQAAVASVTGPDGRSYRVDTYILRVAPFPDATTPNAAVAQIFVAVRQVTNGTIGQIAAQASTSSNLLASS